MLRKLFFYSNVVLAAILFPILGVLATVAYTAFVVVRALVRQLGVFVPRDSVGMGPRRA